MLLRSRWELCPNEICISVARQFVRKCKGVDLLLNCGLEPVTRKFCWRSENELERKYRG